MTDLLKELQAIFPDADATEAWGRQFGGFKFEVAGDALELSIGAMYDAPAFSTDQLMQLVDLFGTKDIDVDHYSEGGCESCDFGSDYGHTFTIRGATQRVEEFRVLAAPKVAKHV